MHVIELILILLACVMASAVLDQIVSRVSMPLIQILVGFVVALLIPSVSDVNVDGELFLLLFIAPLLFNEARESSRQELWNNKWSILSLAVGLVLVTVLVIGFVLHWIVPSIPLAAAFALGAALGPTDAAAVLALGSTVKMPKRQSTLLSGEALINDASGVVSFNFALAAAVTATFSLWSATLSFLWLFCGGILLGAIIGFIFAAIVRTLRRRGLAGTTVVVLFEVFTPFVVFLATEHLEASGVLAAVAAGLAMQSKPRLGVVAADYAEQQVVSSSVWEVAVFLINGVLFVMLGMQLPTAMDPELRTNLSFLAVIGLILLLTFLLLALRFAWIMVMELTRRTVTGKGSGGKRAILKNVLITTVGGPKGAITLSLIMMIPLTVDDGSAFPSRRLLIFLASGVILCTLLLADGLMPIVAKRDETATLNREKELHRASITVLESTIRSLQERIANNENPEYTPAAALTLARYRVRLTRELFNSSSASEALKELSLEVVEAQQRTAEELRKNGEMGLVSPDLSASFPMLQSVTGMVSQLGSRRSLRYRWAALKRRVGILAARIQHKQIDDEQADQMYYDTCIFAIRLEESAIDFLTKVRDEDRDEDEVRVRAAGVLLGEHKNSLNTLKSRIRYVKENAEETYESNGAPVDSRRLFSEQLKKTQKYANDMDATAYSIELRHINRLKMAGEISEPVARELRQNVYVMQMALGE